MGDSTEVLGYDRLDRLTSSHVTVAMENYDATESFHYDDLGNLTEKGGKTYAYTGCAAGGGPHAVCSVGGGAAYSYDANGNLVSGNGRKLTYTPFNKVSHIEGSPAQAGGTPPTVDFIYGADGHRVVQSVAAAETARTVYVGMGATGKSMYERTTRTGGAIEHVQFIYAGGAHGGSAFALRVVKEDSLKSNAVPDQSMRYFLFDHLGSVTAMTDESGRVVGPGAGPDTTVFGYDAWGARRNQDGRPASISFNLQAGHREYTGHETIPSVGLVNMNGRVYDPELGRFLSPDPTVQFVANLQSYNRYSYVLTAPVPD